jgi:hypothetical protein
MTTPPQFSQVPAAPKATGGLFALGIVSIVYASVFRLCCGLGSLMGSAFMALVASGGMQDLMNMPGMEEMPDLGAMASPQMQAYNFINAFVLLILGIAMLAGGIGLIKLKQWARTTLLAVAACELVWALLSFVINVFFIIPSMSQAMGEELGEAPPMMVNIVSSAFGFFISLILPIALLICLNLKSAREQFENAESQRIGMA